MTATQTTPATEAIDFLEALYGDDAAGNVPIFGADQLTRWCRASNLIAVAGRAVEANRDQDVWFGVGLHQEPLGESQRGSAASVVAVPGCWIDIDIAGSAHKSPNLPPTRAAAMSLLSAVPIPPTLVVDTGHGLHGYHLFKEPYQIESEADRQRVASLVKRYQAMIRNRARERGWHLDSTADLSRLLRLPGTVNRKREPVPVRVIHHDDLARYSLDNIEAFLPDDEQLGWTAADRKDDRDFDPADYDRAAAGCGWLAHCQDDAATLSEPVWYAQASIVGRCTDGERIFHEISSAYTGYTVEETDRKLRQALKAAGPRTCRYIRQELDGEPYCASCEHCGTITTPLQLGRPKAPTLLILSNGNSVHEPSQSATLPEAKPAWSVWPGPIDRSAYHGIAGEIVDAVEPHTEADPAALLLTFLSAIGNAFGAGPHWSVSGRKHALRIWPVLVGETSKGRKGTAWGAMRPFLALAAGEWLTRCTVSGSSSGEGLIWRVRDEIRKTEAVKEHGRIVGYQEVVIDPGISDKRLLVIEEEFASLVKVMGREGNTLSAVLRQAWDDGYLSILTKNSPATATGAHITPIGHVTRDELLRHLTSTEAGNGFANRFVWCCVRRSKVLPDGGNLDPAVVIDLGKQLSGVVETAQHIGLIERSDDAADLWRAIYGPLSEGGMGLLGAVTSRAEAQVMRLASLYAVLDQTNVIEPAYLEAAVAIWDYAEASARYIFGDALGDPDADVILSQLRQGGEMTQTEISNLFGRNLSASRIERALLKLMGAGKVTREQRPTDGRPATYWKAV